MNSCLLCFHRDSTSSWKSWISKVSLFCAFRISLRRASAWGEEINARLGLTALPFLVIMQELSSRELTTLYSIINLSLGRQWGITKYIWNWISRKKDCRSIVRFLWFNCSEKRFFNDYLHFYYLHFGMSMDMYACFTYPFSSNMERLKYEPWSLYPFSNIHKFASAVDFCSKKTWETNGIIQ